MAEACLVGNFLLGMTSITSFIAVVHALNEIRKPYNYITPLEFVCVIIGISIMIANIPLALHGEVIRILYFLPSLFFFVAFLYSYSGLRSSLMSYLYFISLAYLSVMNFCTAVN